MKGYIYVNMKMSGFVDSFDDVFEDLAVVVHCVDFAAFQSGLLDDFVVQDLEEVLAELGVDR